MEPLLLNLDEAGRVLGIGRTTLFRLLRDGDMRSVQIGRRRMIDARSLRAYVDRLASGDAAA